MWESSAKHDGLLLLQLAPTGLPCAISSLISLMQELYEHALRLLRDSRMSGKQWDYTMELVSYAVAFGSFFLFVFVAKRAVASPSFDRSRSLFSRLAHSCVAETEYASEKAVVAANE